MTETTVNQWGNMYQFNTFENVLVACENGPDSRRNLQLHEEKIRDIYHGDRTKCGNFDECFICGLFSECKHELHYHHDGCPECGA